MDEMDFSHKQKRSYHPSGAVDLVAKSQVVDIQLYNYCVNTAFHSDCASGVIRTQTSYEHYGSACVPGRNVPFSWVKRIAPTVKLRG